MRWEQGSQVHYTYMPSVRTAYMIQHACETLACPPARLPVSMPSLSEPTAWRLAREPGARGRGTGSRSRRVPELSRARASDGEASGDRGLDSKSRPEAGSLEEYGVAWKLGELGPGGASAAYARRTAYAARRKDGLARGIPRARKEGGRPFLRHRKDRERLV